MTDSSGYDYDPKTDTVRVGRHDLARLLLQFRTELEANAGPDDRWRHMHDYDLSFERLADAVDSGNKPGTEPDMWMRCKRTPAYEWPDLAPYRNGQGSGTHPARIGKYGTHYVLYSSPSGRSLCGIIFMNSEAKKTTGAPTCTACVRELELMCAIPAPEESPAP
ncbi:hypothetical protein OG590_40520 (plasmid) [Streptomyces goshikiensis]|uniref:hypothetical protein n=1 Tax=Streptomyces goshikiensis TaxID=1942 RepID=UPI002F909F16|nr:hypothetical protein OG590_40520 [Streptomyces goshikiensis]